MRSTNITGNRVVLRALEPEDLDLIYMWENDPSEWIHSLTRIPYSRHQLCQFIESQSQNVGCDGQLRFVICKSEVREFRGEGVVMCGDAVGMVDIFEYDPFSHRAGVGIYIDSPYRNQFYAYDAIMTLQRYMVENFEIHQLWCNVSVDNEPSMQLFKKCGFSEVGIKREWHRRGDNYIDELLFQKIISKNGTLD